MDSLVIAGKYGWEKIVKNDNSRGRALGTVMVLPDGRKFVWTKAGGTIGAGKLAQESATSTTYDNALVVPTARAIGIKTITLTNAAATLAVDRFKDGMLMITKSTGLGYQYRIKSQAAATTTQAITVVIADDDGLGVALTTTSEAVMRQNPYQDVVIWPTTATGVPVGVTPVGVVDNDYFWLQVYGACLLLSDAVVWRVGAPIKPSFSVAGAARDANPVAGTASTTSGSKAVIGWARDVSVSADYGAMFLTIGAK